VLIYIIQVQSFSWKRYITDDNDIRPHTVREHNERMSTEFNLVTAESTAHEPPENGRIYMDRNM